MDQKALIVNAGSSSLKTSLYDFSSKKQLRSDNFKNENESLKSSFEALRERLKNTPIQIMGHRIVHGGHLYHECKEVDTNVIKNLTALNELAPLHNPFGVEAITLAKELFGPSVRHFALFDTAFHNSLPPSASLYALDRDLIDKYHIRKYGFHGLACESICSILKSEKTLPKKTIVLHLGSGCSITAILKGLSRDTSMGFTPNDGLVMATRSGDIDPGLVEYLTHKERLSNSQMSELLNKKSGLLGLTKLSNDMKVLEGDYTKNSYVKEAIDVFVERAVKYLGGYIALLEGVDAIVFSGGIGENSAFIRELIIKKFSWHGISLDSLKNRQIQKLQAGEAVDINFAESKAKIFVICVNENLQMLKHIQKFLQS